VFAQYEDQEMAQQEHPEFGFKTQIRRSPYFNTTLHWGTKGRSVDNHMNITRNFGDPTQNILNGINTVVLCDVAITFYSTNVQNKVRNHGKAKVTIN
jgi:hypothetical protein